MLQEADFNSTQERTGVVTLRAAGQRQGQPGGHERLSARAEAMVTRQCGGASRTAGAGAPLSLSLTDGVSSLTRPSGLRPAERVSFQSVTPTLLPLRKPAAGSPPVPVPRAGQQPHYPNAVA